MTPSQTAWGQLMPAPLAGIDLLHVELWQWIGLLVLVLAAWVAWPPAAADMRGNGSDRTV